jgi:putative restriction endonuclease
MPIPLSPEQVRARFGDLRGWKQADGPDTVSNGVALCVLHHKMLDKGALHIDEQLRLLVSEAVHGSDPHLRDLTRLHGSRLQHPQREAYRLREPFVQWHRDEVFRDPAKTG